MSDYYSPSAETEKAARYALGAGFLLILAAAAWAFFAMMLRDEMASSSESSMLLGLSLGAAVVLTVFSAALAVLAGVQTLHNEQVKLLRSAP